MMNGQQTNVCMGIEGGIDEEERRDHIICANTLIIKTGGFRDHFGR